jgi:hypothetical protein
MVINLILIFLYYAVLKNIKLCIIFILAFACFDIFHLYFSHHILRFESFFHFAISRSLAKTFANLLQLKSDPLGKT